MTSLGVQQVVTELLQRAASPTGLALQLVTASELSDTLTPLSQAKAVAHQLLDYNWKLNVYDLAHGCCSIQQALMLIYGQWYMFELSSYSF